MPRSSEIVLQRTRAASPPLAIKKAMVADYLNGLTGPKVAKKHRQRVEILYNYMRVKRIPRRRGKVANGMRKRIVAARAKGATIRELAKTFGLGKTCIFRVVGKGSHHKRRG